MFTRGMRFSRFSVSGAVLVLGLVPVKSFADSCDTIDCLSSTETHLTVDDGSTLNVGTGGVVVDSDVKTGAIHLLDSGQSLRTTILGRGWLQLQDNASAYDSHLKSGQMVVVGTASAMGTTVESGFLDVAENATARDTRINGGTMYVYMDARATHTTVGNGNMNVYQTGHAADTTVNDGGVLSVTDNASASATRVNLGGLMESTAGTVVQDTTVNQGGVMVLGDLAEASDTTINPGGTLQLKGDATLGFASHIDGQVKFAEPSVNGFHTLTIKGPLSGNGTFAMNTDLAQLRGDMLRVQGEISGDHTLVVADSGKAPDYARALTLVDGNGGSGDFQLQGGTVDAGAFRYELQAIGEDWYLISTGAVEELLPVETPDTVPPVDPATPVDSVTPVDPATPADPVDAAHPTDPVAPVFPVGPADPAPSARPHSETLSKGANAAVASHAASAALIGAQMSATAGHFGELRSGKDQGGVWTRGYGTKQHLDTGTSRAFQQQASGMEIGADKALPVFDGTLYVGGLFGQGQGRQDFGEASKGKIDSNTLGGYASYQDRSGLYVDGALKYSRLDNEISITSNLGNKVKANYKNHAVSADVQVGKHIDLGQGWFVEPQAGVQLVRISEGRYTASNGLSVEQDAMTSVQSSLGGLVGRDLQLDNGVSMKPYAKATWITEHAGDSHVKVSGVKLDSRLPGSRAEFGAGIMITAADKHSLFVEGGYTRGNGIKQPWTATVGYRYNW